MSKRSVLTVVLLGIAVPAAVLLGGLLFREKYYAWMALLVAIVACLPLFYAFERKQSSSKELTVVAVLIALSVMGRFLFAWLPGFKPITAITVIAAMWLGKEAGFAVGALSAVISNFYFGQGPWTPFQMCAWGLIGFAAGLLARLLQRHRVWLCVCGALAGVVYSLTMDVWVTVWADGTFLWTRYLASVLTALPITAGYAVSNVLFLLVLAKPIGEMLCRIKTKYGLFLAEGSPLYKKKEGKTV